MSSKGEAKKGKRPRGRVQGQVTKQVKGRWPKDKGARGTIGVGPYPVSAVSSASSSW